MDLRATKIVICGPTASGKSKLAFELAKEIDGVIINFDSQQVYRELPIISSQPSLDQQEAVKHYLYSVVSGREGFSVATWLEMANEVIDRIPFGQPMIFVGGTGLYLNALLHGLSPIPNIDDNVRDAVRNMSMEEVILQLDESSNLAGKNSFRMRRRLEVKMATGKDIEEFYTANNNHRFKPIEFDIYNLNVPRETTYTSINQRFDSMLDNGGLNEIKLLNANNFNPTLPIMKACGVPQVMDYLNGLQTLETAVLKAKQSTRNYAKRQMTWFRHQLPDHKINLGEISVALILKHLKNDRL